MRRIYFNGKIYTVTNGVQQAFVEENGKFIYVGNNDTALKYIQKDSEIIDLENRFVTAGFNDSHMHLLGYGYSLQMINLAKSTSSLNNIINSIKDFIYNKDIKENQWIIGRGWNHDYFSDTKRFPSKYDLDKISTTNPICIIRACGHICVVNSKALEIANITKYTQQIEGGLFDIDENNEPTGVFRENALNLIYNKIPSPDKTSIKSMIYDACKELNKYGITSVHTDDFTVFPNVSYQTIIDSYKELEIENKLSVRIYQQSQLTDKIQLEGFIKKGYKTGVGSEFFKIGPLKLLGDGSLGARTAYLSLPYSDDKNTCGIAVYTQEQLDEIIEYAHRNDMQVAIHGIGDKIMSMIIISIEKALSKYFKLDHRHGIIHCQITTDKILDKFKELNLHAYIQSIFIDYDINIIEDRVGKERAKTTYNFKRMIDSGITLSNGSDCPVELPNVLKGIECAVTRQNLDKTKEAFLPKQAISIEEAIKTFTIMGAYASFEENIKGSIEVGKVCDFVILSDDLIDSKNASIKEIKVIKTYINGECVYES